LYAHSVKKEEALGLDTFGMELSPQQQQHMRRLQDEYHWLQQAQWYRTGAERKRIQERLHVLRINMMYLARHLRDDSERPDYCNFPLPE
jgi:hypothetical protein